MTVRHKFNAIQMYATLKQYHYNRKKPGKYVIKFVAISINISPLNTGSVNLWYNRPFAENLPTTAKI